MGKTEAMNQPEAARSGALFLHVFEEYINRADG
jgi:hypothetical protein